MLKKLIVMSLVVSPVLAFAQEGNNLFDVIINIINQVIPIIFALAVLFFLWNLAVFMFSPAGKQDEARDSMIWGVVILVVMGSIFGIVSIVQNTLNGQLGSGGNSQIDIPTVRFDR